MTAAPKLPTVGVRDGVLLVGPLTFFIEAGADGLVSVTMPQPLGLVTATGEAELVAAVEVVVAETFQRLRGVELAKLEALLEEKAKVRQHWLRQMRINADLESRRRAHDSALTYACVAMFVLPFLTLPNIYTNALRAAA